MPLRILIVEDDKHIRRILESLISKDAALLPRAPELVVAQDGQEGIEALEKAKFDLVISDLLMPRMDGFAFCKALRRHPQHQTVPLIVTSAIYKDSATLNRLHTETGAEFFAKPFQVQELMACVRRLVGVAAVAPVGNTTGSVRKLASTASQAIIPEAPAAATPESGMLADRLPPRLLLELSEQRATGVLTLQRGKVRKDVALLSGVPVTVTSNLRTETLGHFLVARSLLDESRHRQALERAQSGQDRLGRVLIELGWLSEQELIKQLGAQMRAKVTNLLRWREGGWSFHPGEPASQEMHTPVEMARLVFTGLQKSAHVDEIAQELIKLRGRLSPTARSERLREPFSRTFGNLLLEALARRPLIEDLMVGADVHAMMLQLDAMVLCGMVELEAGALAKRGPHESTDPAALEQIVRGKEPAADPRKNLYDELFGGDEISEVRPLPSATAAAVAVAVQRPSLADSDEDEESGVTHLPSGAEAAAAMAAMAAVETVDAQSEALRKEILGEYVTVYGKDYYQVLGVAPNASAADIKAAFGKKQRQFRLDRFSGAELGRDYARLDELNQLYATAHQTLSSSIDRQQYDRVLSARVQPASAALSADLLAQEAKRLLAEGKYLAAQRKLAEAVMAAPDQADYQAHLAWATFLGEGGGQTGASGAMFKQAASQAWVHIEQALAIDPDSLDAHAVAGVIATHAGDDARALEHLQRALDSSPTRSDALSALETVLTRSGEFARLERHYRKLIHRLGEREPTLRVHLWWNLAELYRTRLSDRASATVAYQVMSKLAPDDRRPIDALAALGSTPSGVAAEQSAGLVEAWRSEPAEGKHGNALFAALCRIQSWERALHTAGALALRAQADHDAAAFWKRHRPRFLVRAAQPLTQSLLAQLRHPDDDPDLGLLFAQVFAAARPALSLGDLGVTVGDRVPSDALPESLVRTLAYVAHQLGVTAPPVFKRANAGASVVVGALEEPVLVAGPAALALADRVALGCRLGRALTFSWPGRAEAASLAGRQLKATLLATLTLAQPTLKIQDADGQVANARARLALSPTLARDVAPLVDKLLKLPQGTLNLSRFARGLHRTADRMGLVLCGDLEIAARIAEEGGLPGAKEDLIDFALSPACAAVRQELGLSIAV